MFGWLLSWRSKGLDISPPSYLCSSPLSVSPESNDHQTLLTGDPGGDRCRCYPIFAHFGRGKCGWCSHLSLQPLKLKAQSQLRAILQSFTCINGAMSFCWELVRGAQIEWLHFDLWSSAFSVKVLISGLSCLLWSGLVWSISLLHQILSLSRVSLCLHSTLKPTCMSNIFFHSAAQDKKPKKKSKAKSSKATQSKSD